MNARVPIPHESPDRQAQEDSPSLLQSLLSGSRQSEGEQELVGEVDLEVDGREVTVHAHRRLVLRCGEAAIVLHADGRIELRGTYITSHASATQRIVGGSVDVN